MKVLAILICCVLMASASLDTFHQFKHQYGKTYTSKEEESFRTDIFLNNLKEIERHNWRYDQGLESYRKGLNQFGDLTQAEFSTLLRHNAQKPKLGASLVTETSKPAPASLDWRKKGAVTPVKEQGFCGSCWAFSATGSMEGAHKIAKGKLVSLSEQNLMDCADESRDPCAGGHMIKAFEYVKQNGINAEKEYKYEARNGTCRFNKKKIVLKIKGYATTKRDDEQELIKAIANVGPVSVAIHATDNLQFYTSGLFTDETCSKDKLNHGVLAVGYDNQSIIVKNSWGSSWGESGYVRFKRGSNLCGIASDTSFPLL